MAERKQQTSEIEFSRPVELERLAKNAPYRFDEEATADERTALARLFDAVSVQKFRFSGELRPLGTKSWVLEGDLGATVTQACVVTLAPVKTRIDNEVRRRYVPEIEVDTDDDEVEALGPVIDLGLVATEAASLALPDYPKAPGAELVRRDFAGLGIEPLTDETAKPFAGLKALKDKLAE
jgi:uncharacterized metal-binding protein YceD (DUF177 family)